MKAEGEAKKKRKKRKKEKSQKQTAKKAARESGVLKKLPKHLTFGVDARALSAQSPPQGLRWVVHILTKRIYHARHSQLRCRAAATEIIIYIMRYYMVGTIEKGPSL